MVGKVDEQLELPHFDNETQPDHVKRLVVVGKVDEQLELPHFDNETQPDHVNGMLGDQLVPLMVEHILSVADCT